MLWSVWLLELMKTSDECPGMMLRFLSSFSCGAGFEMVGSIPAFIEP